MRATPLLAAILLLSLPSAGAAADGLSLAGPSSLALSGPTGTTLSLALSLRNVVCARDAEVPVSLSVMRAQGAQAQLASDTVVLRIPQSALARTWTGSGEVALTVTPTAAYGVIEVLARYQLPAGCSALGSPTSGEARHAIGIEEVAPMESASAGDAVLTPARVASMQKGSLPLAVQGAILSMCAGAVIVAVKRIRERAA